MDELKIHLEPAPDARQDEELVRVEYEDGRVEEFRLHDYARIYKVPGLYEEIVLRRLRYKSPERVTRDLIRLVPDPAQLRCLDLGAGNGLVGQHLREGGVDIIVGQDSLPEARDAALRDREGVYTEYVVAGHETAEELIPVVARHGLNCLVSSGALGFHHVRPSVFDALWRAFPARSWLAINLPVSVLEDSSDDLGHYFREFATRSDLELHEYEPYVHRLSMAGAPIRYRVVVAQSR